MSFDFVFAIPKKAASLKIWLAKNEYLSFLREDCNFVKHKTKLTVAYS